MITLRAGPASVAIDRARGGRLASIRVGGLELLVPPAGQARYDPMTWGCFPMVPFAGRLRGGRFAWRGRLHELPAAHMGHAMHGTLYDERWRVADRNERAARLEARLDPRWPFPGLAVQEVTLHRERLELRLEVHAHGEPFPATCGWHPWFVRDLGQGAPLSVDLQASRYYPRGADGLPLGHVEDPPTQGPWDDCFTGITWPVRLVWEGALEAELVSTASHLVLYDQPAHAVCVEPQSGPPDAANLDLARTVRPGDPLVLEAELAWSIPAASPVAPG